MIMEKLMKFKTYIEKTLFLSWSIIFPIFHVNIFDRDSDDHLFQNDEESYFKCWAIIFERFYQQYW